MDVFIQYLHHGQNVTQGYFLAEYSWFTIQSIPSPRLVAVLKSSVYFTINPYLKGEEMDLCLSQG